MEVKILSEYGLNESLLGLSLSYNCPPDKDMLHVANKLAHKDGGHNKFLESIILYLDITATRSFWQQFDTYRIGVTKQSESTMHTLIKRELTHEDFDGASDVVIEKVNESIRKKDFNQAKKDLPESFLQRRIVCTNYKTIRNIIYQRRSHRWYEWQVFCDIIMSQIQHPKWIYE